MLWWSGFWIWRHGLMMKQKWREMEIWPSSLFHRSSSQKPGSESLCPSDYYSWYSSHESCDMINIVFNTSTLSSSASAWSSASSKTCHNDRLAMVFQHEGQGGAGVGESVRPVQDDKPDHHWNGVKWSITHHWWWWKHNPEMFQFHKKKANNFTRKRKRRHVSELCVIFLTHQTAHSFSLYPLQPATQPMKKSSTGLNWTLHFLPISCFYETWSKWKSQAGVVLLYRFKLKIAMGHFFWGTL